MQGLIACEDIVIEGDDGTEPSDHVENKGISLPDP